MDVTIHVSPVASRLGRTGRAPQSARADLGQDVAQTWSVPPVQAHNCQRKELNSPPDPHPPEVIPYSAQVTSACRRGRVLVDVMPVLEHCRLGSE